ncbi:hypothetical protein GYMLUDRAFT_249727 [Collybiopsis luxurians FD-317 M1]|uniref:Retrotransposon gag domain-containing protein n=1 Tax=Collybiopsis luxurians FD-317 M1 TaxID=944289 RepID=A0A0D0CH34_9AGAR|nr:hypothetical protein GYMLUDRAFT_249727 [Collybiopsis luxurians FD-317 M1]
MTRFANESHPVGQYPEQTVTEPNLGCSLWPNHLGFRTDGPTYHRRETPKAFHENNQLEGLGWNARGLVNSPNTTGPGIPFSSQYSDPGNTARVGEQQNQWETLGPGQVKQWNMAYAPPSGERNKFENEGFNFMRSRDNWDLSFSEDQLCPSALETHHPMPPLEKKEFTPLQNVKGRGKVVNPFIRESSCQTSEPLRITEVPPQQPAAAGFTPPVFTAAPRQYVHLTGRNFDSIPAIPHRSLGQVMNDYHPIVSTQQEPARVPADQYWRSGTREYRPYVAEPTYDYLNCASTYRGYGAAGAPGGPLYGGVAQTGGISEGNLERERDSRNGSFRGGSGGGGPGGPGGPGSPGGPPNNPDDWGLNHDAYWHPANGWVAVQGPRGERGEPGPAGQDAMKLDVKKPDPFDGSDRWKWEPFLLQVHRTFMAKPTIYKNNSDKIGFAVLYLTGAAATHYNNLLKQEEAGIPVPALHTWIDFVAEFTLYFRLFDPAQDAQVKLAWIKQMDNESFVTFIIRFQEYAFKMGYNDTALVAML